VANLELGQYIFAEVVEKIRPPHLSIILNARVYIDLVN
jgi:hypothetical protein